MEKDNFYNNLAADTEYNRGSGHVQQAQMIDGAMYTLRSRREDAELERAKRREEIGIPNLDEGIQWGVTTAYDKKWDTGRVATAVGKPGAYVNRLFVEAGVNPNKTHFEVSGDPVAWILLSNNPDYVEKPLTREQRRALLDEVKFQSPTIVEAIEAKKATEAQVRKSNGTKNKKTGRR